jgi:SagB-type dehydrogenase family enzyme
MANMIHHAVAYHQRTKHHLRAYARSLGYLDWANQPNPFRSFAEAPRLPLRHPHDLDSPSYDALFTGGVPAQPVNHPTISQLFYDALALSAWKEATPGNRWSLRVNPSSGDLHPTEGYLIIGPSQGLGNSSAVYHYTPYAHALEQRVALTAPEWEEIVSQLPRGAFLIGLTSIYWRESWKYGERAFRYCHHDVGHAIGTIALAAAVLGWRVALLNGPATEEVDILLGCHQQQGIEAEHADCLLAISPGPEIAVTTLLLPVALLERLQHTPFAGHPNRLSREHYEWPIINNVAAATRYPRQDDEQRPGVTADVPMHEPDGTNRKVFARPLIHRRRSAVAMDGQTWIDEASFYGILKRVTPTVSPFPYAVLRWRPRLSLALLVHRVQGVRPGLYLLIRHPSHQDSLHSRLKTGFLWQKPARCPRELGFYLLAEGDVQKVAHVISCHQDIAADGVFSLGMLAQFEQSLEEGAWMYPRLFWEAGLIGQVLYLEAEAAGIRATGIGCFFDDAMHDLLGISDRSWQSLYHFTLGGAVDDPRLTTLHPYTHQGMGPT